MYWRFIFKAIAIVVVAFAGISYLAYLRTGTYWLPTFSNPGWPATSLTDANHIAPPKITQPAYKWREKGRWVYGDKPPPGVTAIPVQEEN